MFFSAPLHVGCTDKYSSSLSDNDIIQAERSLYRVRHDLVAKREEISRQNVSQDSGNGGWMGRVFGSKADQGGSRFSHICSLN